MTKSERLYQRNLTEETLLGSTNSNSVAFNTPDSDLDGMLLKDCSKDGTITKEPKSTPLPEMLNHVTGTLSRSGVYTVKEEPEVEDVTEM